MECNRTWNDPLTSYVAAFEKLLEVDGRYYCRMDDTRDGSRLSIVLDLFSRRVIGWL